MFSLSCSSFIPKSQRMHLVTQARAGRGKDRRRHVDHHRRQVCRECRGSRHAQLLVHRLCHGEGGCGLARDHRRGDARGHCSGLH